MNSSTLRINILANHSAVLAILVITGLLLLNCNSKQLPTVGITQIVSHPSLDQVREGVIQGLAERGYVDGKNVKIIFRNANGDASLTLPIAQDFVRQEVKVIVPIATPSALGAAKSTKTIPIVFGGVTDPISVGLVPNLTSPGGNITGTSDRWPFKQQLELFSKILPNMRRLGCLYKPGDDVSKIAIDSMKELAPSLNIEFVTKPVSGPAEVYPSAVSLFQQVDAIYTGLDNLVVENLESILKAAQEANKPVLAGDVGSVERGALTAYSISMIDLGIMTGKMVADVLEGKNPGDMPVQVVTEGHGIANREAAKTFKIDLQNLEKLGVELK